MKPQNLFLSIILATVLVVLLSAGGLLVFNATRMLPKYDGVAYVQGLTAPAEIIRDELGVPHIYASTPEDLFFAQGYVHAQDRWWQMEFQRHTGMGRIEELTGYNPAALGSDLFIRTWGWNRAAEADLTVMAPDTQAVLEAYSAGVNAYLAGKHGGDLALEYTLLQVNGVSIEIEPWEPLHTAAWAKVMAWDLSGNASQEARRMALVQELGEEMVAALYPEFPFSRRPTILTSDDLPITDSSLTAAAASATRYADLNVATAFAGGPLATAMLPPQNEDIGSNNWVIAGSNTESGMPLLANDPHLGIQMPSIWYQIGLHCRPVTEECPYDVVGFGFAGAPAVVVGHNQHLAWGVTNVGPDVQDLYIIRVNPDNPYQYEYNGEWRDMEAVEETIHFGNQFSAAEDDPATEQCEGISDLPIDDAGNLTITVRVTHFGPIISDNRITDDCRFVALTEDLDEDPLALRWTALEPGDLLGAIININRASDWESFRDALRGWDWPAQNFVYADTAGNIGYQTPGKMPIRATDHDGLLPVPGWTDEYEWQSYIPFDLLPRILNPARGWIVTANNAVVPPAYYDQLAAELGQEANYMLDREWAEGYRAQRIVSLVSASAAHTVESVAAIQGDNHSTVAEEVLPYLVRLNIEDETLSEAIQWLLGWDLQTSADSPQAALFEMFWARLAHNLWADQLDGGVGGAWATTLLLDTPENPWWDDIATPETETRDEILVRSLTEALDELTNRFGADRESWRWGDLHTATFVSNPLGQSGIGLIESLVNRGPVATGGSSRAVNNTAWSERDPFDVIALPSFRMIIDLADFENSQAIHTTGQSGHPFSPHYGDMIDLWRNVDYRPLPFGQEAVEASAASRLELRPAPAVHGE
ncbi:MAG: penicillin acylase family protein [Anaerolineae bacterium]